MARPDDSRTVFVLDLRGLLTPNYSRLFSLPQYSTAGWLEQGPAVKQEAPSLWNLRGSALFWIHHTHSGPLLFDLSPLSRWGRSGHLAGCTGRDLSASCRGGLLILLILVIGVTRYASVGSLTETALTPIILLALGLIGTLRLIYTLHGVLAWIIIAYSHRPSIFRLLQGTERCLGERR